MKKKNRTGKPALLAALTVLLAFVFVFSGCDSGAGTGGPSAPQSVQVSGETTANSIHITWSASPYGPAEYRVERANSSAGPWTTITRTSSNQFTDTGLPPNTTMFYRITRIVNGVESRPSQVISGTTRANGAGGGGGDQGGQGGQQGNIAVTGVSLNRTSTSILVGATETLFANVEPANATNQNVNWSSSNPAIATVSTGGLVTAVAAGTATITVTTADGGRTASANVTASATAVAVTGVSIPASISLNVGATQTLTPTITPSNATNQNVNWSSSNSSIATVSAWGLVTGVAAGTATITVTTADGGRTANTNVTVTAAAIPPFGTYGNFSWSLEGGNITINGYTGTGGAVTIPAAIHGYPVRIISAEAFHDRNLSNVNIPNSVTHIGMRAFSQNGLTSVNIPSSVTYIGYAAFAWTLLTSVNIPPSVTHLGSGAFSWVPLTSVNIPSSITYIGEFTFHPTLTSITIGANVTFHHTTGFPNCFKTAYNNGGRLAGTYTRPYINSIDWTRQ